MLLRTYPRFPGSEEGDMASVATWSPLTTGSIDWARDGAMTSAEVASMVR